MGQVELLGKPGFWITATITGDFNFNSATFPIAGPPVIGPQIGTRHGSTWFGVEDQQKSLVQHFTEDVQITFTDGTTDQPMPMAT